MIHQISPEIASRIAVLGVSSVESLVGVYVPQAHWKLSLMDAKFWY